jgi:peptidoglycan/xylan/chitin deacetylase (PgdA/CDA1 family)
MSKKGRPIAILMYHQIDQAPPKGSPLRGLVVAPRTFYFHMAVMLFLGYRGLSMSDLEPYLQGDKTGKVFGITFDDGYVNNLHHALPVLKRFGFTSTCYVVPGLLGKTNMWDAGKGIAQVPLMDVADLQSWVVAGQEVGSHTMTHANLPSLDDAERTSEVAGSKAALESVVLQGGGVRHFCYPYGAINAQTIEAARAGGFATATTTIRGRIQPGGKPLDALRLPRVLVSRTTTWLHLLLKCFTRYEDKRMALPVGYDQTHI